ncbi:Autophagy protein 7 [Brettanomyces nanus]|uniref:Ubiquitin-like modifier-activating enzyme ATG7 n=1 Tax=Eeniella nana TaxID=13502 RepID=A0A875RWR4_EENNA|nr:Autophagy protein 7 [Brettanomyces nanus]QPG73366.1 Autophagy protein 7 [Brettanomyces nanus]
MPSQISLEHTNSFVDSSFFVQLSKIKLDVMKLDVSPKQIYGSSPFSSLSDNSQPSINLNDASFGTLEEFEKRLPKNSSFISPGRIMNVNTLEDFKKLDKKTLLRKAADYIDIAIRNKSVLRDPSLLSQFFVLSFSDLKKYKFYYWFAFPLLHPEYKAQLVDKSIDIEKYTALLGKETINQISVINGNSDSLLPFADLLQQDSSKQLELLFVDTATEMGSFSYVLGNLIAALSVYGFAQARIFVHHIHFHKKYDCTIDLNISTEIDPSVHISGWERMSGGRLGPKMANLGSLIDPLQLADQAVDLNLKLMRWRVAPNLNLDVIRNCKCLLLGSGTLGSYVARALLAWGVRKITFVDNGKVSFSNPVRQPLYNFDDCLEGGQPKAEAAALNLKKVFPKVDAQGYTLDVPMAGHPVTNEKREKKDFVQLCKLFDESDAVFILMDSRETRWLPTVLGNAKNKIVINAALGFESYLVMRHGCINPSVPFEDQEETRLGCYFCNDVYAPSDSLTDRTLDQMCTVTRPSVAMMASSLAVELFVSILQHKDKQFAPHSSEGQQTVLGCLPHQMRGFLHNFEILKLSARNFKYCSACSIRVIEEFNKNGWEFVKKTLDNPKYLEDLVGLTKIHDEAEKAALELDAIDSEDEMV